MELGGGGGGDHQGGNMNIIHDGQGQGREGVCVVPPGFRFHPTDEELLYYYLRKKVSYESIDLDVIREVDLNKLEPWDLKEKCRIGSGPQNEWYFFSHKDKKYPTGTRTNRATAAGFWKATGRDKAIHLTSKRIGMRKTLVFYTGRAPHGQKTDWIMHEYRLDEDHITNNPDVQEDGWVVCRVFMKKIHSSNNRGFEAHEEVAHHHHQEEEQHYNNMLTANPNQTSMMMMMMKEQKQNLAPAALYDCCTTFDGSNSTTTASTNSSMHHHQYLPQLLSSGGGGSPDHHHSAATVPPSHIYQRPPSSLSFLSPNYQVLIDEDNNNNMDIVECSQNILRLTSASATTSLGGLFQQQQQQQEERFATDWSFLDKLLASSSSSPSTRHQSHRHHHHQHLDQPHKSNLNNPASSSSSSSSSLSSIAVAARHPHHMDLLARHRFPFQYLGFETDLLKFPK